VAAEPLQADPLDEAAEWMHSRKRTREARMDRLDAHLRRKRRTSETGWSAAFDKLAALVAG